MAMTRTIVSLDEGDKQWLDREAQRRGMSMAQLLRLALKALRNNTPPQPPSFDSLLDATAGTWPLGDGLAYQRKVRGEW